MIKETGGPAFPHESYDYDTDMDRVNPGLTMRDYFAGQALPGLIQAYATKGFYPTHKQQEVVYEAYVFADAMLAHRNREAGDE